MKEIEFLFCESNYIQRCLELNPFDKFDIEYTPYSNDCGYWTIKNIFKNFDDYVDLSKKFIVYKSNIEYNPFCDQLISYDCRKKLESLLHYFNENVVPNPIEVKKTSFWANLYIPKLHKDFKLKHVYPHIDCDNKDLRLICNLWLTKNNGCTTFWKFKDSCVYSEDFIRHRCDKINSNEIKFSDFPNFNGDENFEKVGQTSNEYGTITMYYGNQIHSATLPDVRKDIRWSHIISNI